MPCARATHKNRRPASPTSRRGAVATAQAGPRETGTTRPPQPSHHPIVLDHLGHYTSRLNERQWLEAMRRCEAPGRQTDVADQGQVTDLPR